MVSIYWEETKSESRHDGQHPENRIPTPPHVFCTRGFEGSILNAQFLFCDMAQIVNFFWPYHNTNKLQ